MRFLLVSMLAAAALPGTAFGEPEELIGQLGNNREDTGQRSSANLSQIGPQAHAGSGLVDQIDPSTSDRGMDVDETRVGKLLPGNLSASDCSLSSNQQAIIDYLKTEGRVFDDNCEMLAWLSSNNKDDPSERDLFNVIFGPEADRQKKAELDRLEREQARAEAQARMLEAINGNRGGGGR